MAFFFFANLCIFLFIYVNNNISIFKRVVVIIKKHIEKTTLDKIYRITSQFSKIKFINLDKLQSQLIFQLKFIKKYYKEINYKSKKTNLDRWIYDNYYILEREGKLLQMAIKNSYLPTSMYEKHPDIYYIFKEVLAEKGFSLSTESILELIEVIEETRYLKNFELDFLTTIIKIASIDIIYNSLIICDQEIDEAKEDKRVINVSLSIGNIRLADNIDMEKVMFKKNKLDKTLQQDPDNIYNKMNDTTKKIYRYKISKISLEKDLDEIKLAEIYLKKSLANNEHIGNYIYADYNKSIKSRIFPKIYIPLLFLLPLLVAIPISLLIGNIFLSILIYFPIWEIFKTLIDYYVGHECESEYAPRLELAGEIPSEFKTLVVVSTLLTNSNDLENLKEKLEDIYYKNKQDNIYFLILADLKESKQPIMNDDKVLINKSKQFIKVLNEQYDNKFMIVVRKRKYCETQNTYCGYERKRGAITNLIGFMKGDVIDYELFEGDYSNLKKCKYILALDTDTKVLMESVESLLGVAIHPMNKPVIDKEKNIVKKGYGIISPRMIIDLKESLQTPFSKTMGGIGGVSSYDLRCTDIYQDIYEEGIFCGKGLICVDTFYEIMMNLFLDNTILSHDILEGSFLRTRYVSDIELVDGFPNNATSFFKRLNRWIRGDYQNIPYIFNKIKTPNGNLKNPLNIVSKFKLFDNLRRAITPICIIICFIISFFSTPLISKGLVIISTTSILFPYIFRILNSLIHGEIFSLSRKYYSRVIPESFEVLSQLLYNLILLPKLAINSIDAISKALYRKFISKKKLLEWTTAAQVDRLKNTFIITLSQYFLAELFGLFLLISNKWYLNIFGLVFILIIPLVVHSKKRYHTTKYIASSDEREDLISLAVMMFSFYDDYCIKEDNYLPPDNLQETPIFRVAHRTSPTNIGLYMLSCLSLKDFNIIDNKSLYTRLNNVLNTIDKLEKWNGNLYNWYNTVTLEILQPSFVSAVDSGNFVCSLIALKEGLKEYKGEYSKLEYIINRIDILVNSTDIGVFYDRTKNLLKIGYDATNNCFSGSHYDMLMSEARMTSYFAIAKRQVPKKHWGFLGRTLAKLNSYTGPVSWTGTMFEYFMPELLLHCIEGSLGYEGLRFCLYCQKQRVKSMGIPFGISESGYYAFDNQLNYQYKAYGVQKIALKRGMNEDLVVSPYSSYLTLSYDFENSLKNLREITNMGVLGKYGHYEAIDFTKDRIGNQNYMIIKSYMAHHIGMSIVGISNALSGNLMQKRFLRDKSMNSASELLQEKVSVGAIVFEDVYLKNSDKKIPEFKTQNVEFSNLSPFNPRIKILSNGDITSICSDIGVSYIKYQQKDLTKRTTDLIRDPIGIFGGVKIDDEVIPFTFAPMYDNKFEYKVCFENNTITYITNSEKLQTGVKIAIHSHIACEQRQIVIKNNTNQKQHTKCMLYLQPVLSNYIDDNAHQSFSKLFINIEYYKESNIIIAKRKIRDKGHPIYLGVGFLENIEFEYETNRENILKRPKGITSVYESFEELFNQGDGTPDPCIAIRFKSIIQSNSQNNCTLFTLAGNSREEIINNFVNLRDQGEITKESTANSPLVVDSLEGRISEAILPSILYNVGSSDIISKAIEINKLNLTNLWQFGISGDLQIILLNLESKDDIYKLKSHVMCQSTLRLCTVDYDIVILFNDDKLVANLKLEIDESLIGLKGGVHLINISTQPEEILTLLKATCCYYGNEILTNDLDVKYFPITFNPVNKQKTNLESNENIYEVDKGFFYEDKFYVTGTPKLPWCHILANPVFGNLLSDKSLGFSFAINSRENKITPWSNDTMLDNQGEMLIVRLGDNYFDIINGATAIFSPNYVEYIGEFENIKTKVRVVIPSNGMVKKLEVELENGNNSPVDIKIVYYIEPVLGVSRDSSRQVSQYKKGNILYVKNPFNQSVRSYVGITCDQESLFLCDRFSFMSGNWDKEVFSKTASVGCIVSKTILPKESTKLVYKMIFSSSEQAIKVIDEIQDFKIHEDKNKIVINTKDNHLNFMFNTWLPWQNLGCRIYGRTGFFQCGGAYGFRDQLQDVSSYVLLDPDLAKTHIIRACSSQFFEGDVLHWWHNLPKYGGGKKGVRTRYSDDLLWLPYTLCEYINKTNDYSILDIKVSYLSGEVLSPDEHERYLQVEYSDKKESVYEHCIRAIDKAYTLGENNLPLMGCGDWNDGYNKVGENARGESVWLGQFLSIVLSEFSAICDFKKDKNRAIRYKENSKKLLSSIDESCWDGDWYIRAFFDNGEKMGTSNSDECKIDSLPQSFSVISNMPDKDRVKKAMESAYAKLVDKEYDIIKLFTPAYSKSSQNPGYVKSYPEGVRENGGQYTHASVWFAMATLMMGEVEKGYDLINMLNPAYRYKNKELSDKYMLEPYYMAADIYTNKNAYARGGWSLYTGAAGWYYKVIFEHFLGIKISGETIKISPNLPKEYNDFEINMVYNKTRLNIKVRRKGKYNLIDNGSFVDYIKLDGKLHEIEVNI